VRPVINMKTTSGVHKFETIANEVADLVLEYGGALSGEHGDGLVRSPFLKKMFGDKIYEAFREVKRTFDPEGIFNPGKIVDAPPLTSNLRFGSNYTARNPQTFFDFSEYGGIAGAVEMCSGVGACRKTLAGNMCPSYMATREESDSTRGRANVLRLAISGRLDQAGLGDVGVFRVLDLCLECRACKTECPIGVDMARFKSEFLADYYSRHGTPLQARILGNIARLSKWASQFAPLSNRMPAPFIDTRRKLPPWKRETFARWSANHQPAPGKPATLFNDTFTNHYEPEIGSAAVEVLERGGCRVNIVRPGCCGRPLISQGLLREARSTVTKLIEALFPIADRGEKILFCEPSCLSAVKEDAPSLLRDEAARKARSVAEASVLFDEFASQLDLPLRAGPERILLHGHCHQKSMGLLDRTRNLLSKIPSANVIELDAGCCGMAGSFGYTHYDVSVAIAIRKLIPAVNAMQPGEILVAPGTSCRRQIADLAGAIALHPATLIHSLLK
jgi:Fe-S oxidoreductase